MCDPFASWTPRICHLVAGLGGGLRKRMEPAMKGELMSVSKVHLKRGPPLR